MSEYISREAIDNLTKSDTKGSDYDRGWNDALYTADILPSAFEGMTNGDIFTNIYPDHEAEKVGLYMVLQPKGKKGIGDTHILVDLDFWNALYKESKT